MGLETSTVTLNIILPVGISFYTFQTLSYTIDIYRNKLTATRNPITFFAFVSFFPQLVAGPIERASSLLPQFEDKKEFSTENAKDGLRQILWGLFKKVVVADSMRMFSIFLRKELWFLMPGMMKRTGVVLMKINYSIFYLLLQVKK